MENFENNENLLDGISKASWHCFIDKNASRYVDIYAKNEGKKFFISWNWAAFFFGVSWMFYRKMYKIAVLFMLLEAIITILVMTLISGAYSHQLKPLFNEIIAYEENFDSNDFITNDQNTTIEVNGDPIKAYEAREEVDFIMEKINLWSVLVIVVLQIFYGLFADCIYKLYIQKNIYITEGGTSYLAFFVGDICNSVFYDFAVSPVAVLLIEYIFNLALR